MDFKKFTDRTLSADWTF